MIVLKKLRNVVMLVFGFGLLGFTYVVYLEPKTPQKQELWRGQLGDWYESFPYYSVPLGVLIVLFSIMSTLVIMLGNQPERQQVDSDS